MPEHTPRATRYPVTLLVRYRAKGDARWSYGMTVNMSHTGILFRANRDANDRRPLEIEVVLPGDAEGDATLVSHGAVARAQSEADDDTLAVSLDDYTFVRTPRASGR